MIASLLTAFFFALSAIFGRHSTTLVGSQWANLGRQIVAILFLGLWAHTMGQGLHGSSFAMLFLSGVIGFGVGDWALFEAYPRIGAALTILLAQCLAAPIAAFTEWIWLGTVMTSWQLGGSMLALLGVALAVAPGRKSEIPHGHMIAGILYGLIAATGQAWGAVLSRYAFHQAAESHFALDGGTAAYQRIWGGLLSLVVLMLLRHLTRRWHSPDAEPFRPDWNRGGPWILANALAGAVIGVSCYQWALKSSPSAVVLPIVATTPLIVMLIAFVGEGIRPSTRAILGSVLAVGGVVVLVLSN